MTTDDMTDLVADYTGELIFGVDEREKSTADIDVTAGQREGIRLCHVDDLEAELPVGFLGHRDQPLTDVIDPCLEHGVLHDAHFSIDLGRCLITDLLLSAHQRQTAARGKDEGSHDQSKQNLPGVPGRPQTTCLGGFE